ncbi:MAG: hypothetical protein GY906_10845 [bacterium]|nr:hypothetical protein [bacterium]
MAETIALIDNTTFAAAGRTFYHNDPSGKGGLHAREYYSEHRDAKAIDRQSTSEFLTALVLFDSLRWDSASSSGETPAVTDDRRYLPWLYDWFPLFHEASQLGIIEDFEERYVSWDRLNLAQQLAFKWVEEQIATEAFQLPSNFRVPLAYYSEDYADRGDFERLNAKNDWALTEDELAIAMFLHRGLYYQSYSYGPSEWVDFEGWSYLPHSYRASLLRSPSWNLLATVCNDQDLWLGQMHKLEITAPEIVRELDRRFFQALDKTVKIEPIPGGVALGWSFLQENWREPTHALESALEFRESRSGKEVRAFFGDLVALGKDSNRQAIEDRLGDFEKMLQGAARRRFGTSWTPDPKAGFLIGLTGSWKDVLAPALDIMPRRIREAVIRVLYTSTYEHGFQILFNSYL